MNSPHICQESRTCQCSIQALEPNENCPIHGCGEWPPRCEHCGRIMKRERDKEQGNEKLDKNH